jgi:sec-independent protein translocase protein TatC
MCLFALPMLVLYYLGVFLGYLFVIHREGRRFPWVKVLKITVLLLLLVSGGLYIAITRHMIKLVPHWPFFTR